MQKQVGLFVAVALGCLGGWGCVDRPGSDEADSVAGNAVRQRRAAAAEVRIGVRGDVNSFNIYTATKAFTQEVANLTFLNLIEERPPAAGEPPRFAPSIAAEWNRSEDGLAWTFRLDPNAKWSDGSAITAQDVLFSQRAAASPEVGWVARDVKERIQTVEAIDDRTVRIRFAEPSAYSLMDAMEGNVLPRKIYGEVPFAEWPRTAFLEAPLSSGPFLLERYESSATIELARNPQYLKSPLPRLDRVVFRVIPDERTLVDELLSGGVDVAGNLPAQHVERLEAHGGFDIVRTPDLSYTFICWNTARVPFDDPRVRRAMTMAIDRASLIEGILPHNGRPAAGPIPSLLWAHDPDLVPPPFDREGALQLLREAGFEDHDGDGTLDRDGKPLRFVLETNRESSLRRNTLEFVAAQLKAIGVDAQQETLEFGAFIDRHERHDFDAFISSWRESNRVDLKNVFHSSAVDGAYNYGAYRNARLDGLIDRARGIENPADSAPLWFEAQQIVAEDQPYTFLFEQDRLDAFRKGLGGIAPSSRSTFDGLERWHWKSQSQ